MAIFNKATNDVLKEIAIDYDKYQQRLFSNLVSSTPIDTGNAQRGWKNVSEMSKLIGTGKKAVVIRNDIAYIQRLDDGYSRQAPKGIVGPVLNKTRKP
tara:strand:- start:1023 stop:1316 length:294 start_codon:yes stop_codon:yes gene_type:complete